MADSAYGHGKPVDCDADASQVGVDPTTKHTTLWNRRQPGCLDLVRKHLARESIDVRERHRGGAIGRVPRRQGHAEPSLSAQPEVGRVVHGGLGATGNSTERIGHSPRPGHP